MLAGPDATLGLLFFRLEILALLVYIAILLYYRYTVSAGYLRSRAK